MFLCHSLLPVSKAVTFAIPDYLSLQHVLITNFELCWRPSIFAGRLCGTCDLPNPSCARIQLLLVTHDAAACFNCFWDTSSKCVPVGFFLCPNMYATPCRSLRSCVPFFQRYAEVGNVVLTIFDMASECCFFSSP